MEYPETLDLFNGFRIEYFYKTNLVDAGCMHEYRNFTESSNKPSIWVTCKEKNYFHIFDWFSKEFLCSISRENH